MKVIPLSEAKANLSHYGRSCHDEPIIVTVNGVRDSVVIHTGKVGSLRRFKDDVAEVKNGFECGIGIANYTDLKDGDIIEFFVTERIAAQSL